MKRLVFKLALTTLATCALAAFANSTARAQSSTSFMTAPLGSVGGQRANAMFGGAANGMFRTPSGAFDTTPRPFGSAPPGTPLGGVQYDRINNFDGTPGAYGPSNGNSSEIVPYDTGVASGYGNYGDGHLNNDTGYSGYNPYYGNGDGYGVNYGRVNSGSYGSYAPSAYYENGISGNGYYGGGYANANLGYRGYSPYYGNHSGYGVNYGGVYSGFYGNPTGATYYGSANSNGIYGNEYYPQSYSAPHGAYMGYGGDGGSYELWY
jgi:hypothetical protein